MLQAAAEIKQLKIAISESECAQEALVQKINIALKNLEDVVDENKELRKQVTCTMLLVLSIESYDEQTVPTKSSLILFSWPDRLA